MCGSAEFLKQEGVFICQSCGLKYSAEEMKKMLSENSVEVVEADTVDNSNNYIPVVIPKRFTDEYLEDQKSSLEEKIYDLEEKIEKLKEKIQEAGDKRKECHDEIYNGLQLELRDAREQVAVGRHNQQSTDNFSKWRSHEKNWQKRVDELIYAIQQAENKADKFENDRENMKKIIEEKKGGITMAKTKLRETEILLPKTPAQRMEKHYQTLLENISISTSIDKLIELAKQFREMEGYKNTEILGYNQLIQAKSKSSSEDDFLRLSKQFKEMNGYENSEVLATECKDIALKIHYEQLVQAKAKASSEADFIKIAKQFRDMKGYKNTNELAIECDNQSQIQREKAYNDVVAELQKLDEELQKRKEKGFKPFSDDYKKMSEKYKVLSEKFKNFNNYKGATNFVNECEKNSNECKKKEDKQNMGCFWIVVAIVVLSIVIFMISQ